MSDVLQAKPRYALRDQDPSPPELTEKTCERHPDRPAYDYIREYLACYDCCAEYARLWA